MTNTMSTNFKFRSKFEKLIESDEQRQAFIVAFDRFCNFEPKDARDFLWLLTYVSDDISAFLALNKLGLNLEMVPMEKISKLRDELRFQYEELHNGFLKVEVAEECMDAFTALSNKADLIVAAIVYKHCTFRRYVDEESMQRFLFLLDSDLENNFFGGIRSLHFGSEEAVYLKPFHKQIHNLLKAVYEQHQKQSGFSSMNTPFQGLDKQLEDAGYTLPEGAEDDLPFVWGESKNETPNVAPVEVAVDTPIETPDVSQDEILEEIPDEVPATAESVLTDSDSKFKELTPKNVWESQDVFSYFIASLNQLRELGFDLNQVIAKEEAIINLLKAAEALSN